MPLTPKQLETLEEKVAQLFMLGYEGQEINLKPDASIMGRFLQRGLGGVIFFRDNFEPAPGQPRYPDAPPALTAEGIRHLLQRFQEAIPAHLLRPLLGIDQEGGQVERLPHTVFPTGLTPQAVALSTHSEFLARTLYGDMAQRLRTLGFNLDFFPTLDVNLNPENPIIGVRAFSNQPDVVETLGLTALESFERKGLIAVGKHFPGHGNGTVDSHYDLPALTFSEEELQPFKGSIEAGLPVMLIAHGLYPGLQPDEEIRKGIPSSASSHIIDGLLRQQCGFKGVVITDDMCMGAITKHCSPTEAAIASIEAGVDILLYRRSSHSEWDVYEAVLDAFKSGRLSQQRLDESLTRIATLKKTYLQSSPNEQPDWEAAAWNPEICQQQADTLAAAALPLMNSEPARKMAIVLHKENPLWLIHPKRVNLGNYAWDIPTSPELDDVFRQVGFESLLSIPYDFRNAMDSLNQTDSRLDFGTLQELASNQKPQALIFVAFNAQVHHQQADLAQRVHNMVPNCPVILVSAGEAGDARSITQAHFHIPLCGYRPAAMRVLANRLARVPHSDETADPSPNYSNL